MQIGDRRFLDVKSARLSSHGLIEDANEYAGHRDGADEADGALENPVRASHFHGGNRIRLTWVSQEN
jgi:hypothetical protein